MESHAKLLGHPAHPILVTLPIGAFTASVGFDIGYFVTRESAWAQGAQWLIAGGVVTAAAAAVAGYIDYRAIPTGTRARRIGMLHGVGNAVVSALFLASWVVRRDTPAEVTVVEAAISWGAFALSGLTAWLGGELVDRLGVGVSPDANLNAPNSLAPRRPRVQEHEIAPIGRR
jgi:uncharacterized membrane protein